MKREFKTYAWNFAMALDALGEANEGSYNKENVKKILSFLLSKLSDADKAEFDTFVGALKEGKIDTDLEGDDPERLKDAPEPSGYGYGMDSSQLGQFRKEYGIIARPMKHIGGR